MAVRLLILAESFIATSHPEVVFTAVVFSTKDIAAIEPETLACDADPLHFLHRKIGHVEIEKRVFWNPKTNIILFSKFLDHLN